MGQFGSTCLLLVFLKVRFFLCFQGYMRPLKQPDSSSIVDPLLVDEIFYQIPEILEHHENFLEQVAGCVGQWHDRQTVGQILIQSVSRDDDKSSVCYNMLKQIY